LQACDRTNVLTQSVASTLGQCAWQQINPARRRGRQLLAAHGDQTTDVQLDFYLKESIDLPSVSRRQLNQVASSAQLASGASQMEFLNEPIVGVYQDIGAYELSPRGRSGEFQNLHVRLFNCLAYCNFRQSITVYQGRFETISKLETTYTNNIVIAANSTSCSSSIGKNEHMNCNRGVPKVLGPW
jgi:hypothetical protein